MLCIKGVSEKTKTKKLKNVRDTKTAFEAVGPVA